MTGLQGVLQITAEHRFCKQNGTGKPERFIGGDENAQPKNPGRRAIKNRATPIPAFTLKLVNIEFWDNVLGREVIGRIL
jgi:hypothetical protein